MKKGEKLYYTTSSTLFLVVSAAHAIRIIYGFDMVIESWFVPMWASGLISALTFILASHGILHLAKNR